MFEKYLNELKTTGLSESTIKGYEFAYRCFKEYVKSDELSISKEKVRNYLLLVMSRNDIPINRKYHYLYPLKKYYSWLIKKGHILLNPFEGVIDIKPVSTVPKLAPSERDINRAIKKGSENLRNKYIQLRDRAMYDLSYSSGLRCMELVNLDIKDIDFTEGIIRVKGKGNRERLIPVGKKALESITEYLYNGRPFLSIGSRSNALFISLRRNRLSKKGLCARFDKNCKIGSHMFRRAFATHMLKNGANIVHIQKMLGHSRLDTTRIYTRLKIEDLKKEHKKNHPRG